MSKPFDEAQKLQGICRFCIPLTNSMDISSPAGGDPEYLYRRTFTCGQRDVGISCDFCSQENYLACPFNEVRLHSRTQPPLSVKPATATKPPAIVNKAPVPPPSDPATGKPKFSAGYIDDLKGLVFNNEGEFFTACHRYFKLIKSQVEPWVKQYDLSKPEPRKLGWLDVIQSYEKWLKEEKS